MRKHQKKKLQNFINTLYEAHDEIKKSVEAELPEQAMGLLAQCQEAAIKIGSLIEETEGETFVTIGFLEHYCELLYHIHEELSAGKAGSAGKVHKLLRKKLISVENSIKNDIPVQIEAVFLPYKASMWDSLESVWQAAEEDQNCNAYVMPIPYFDRNPDGSFGEMHYEGEQFPAYVPITHYESYPLSEQCPDVIFIHNPYDEQNYVTSVHPAFYSSTLKQCTDCLVYIPYFVLREVSPDNNRAVDVMKHLCTTRGVINADKVIVQSEDMKQVYIKTLMEQIKATSKEGLGRKILALGSPKIERIRNTSKEELEIPESWLKKMRKPDGSLKRIVLYNTSIGALLQQSEWMLEKMQDVFHTFKAQQNDITFIWRPHPLIPATIQSMRPELQQKYRKMEEDYCREGWGIYDTTPDVDRAVILGDCYYGDWSSVIELYLQTERPVILQNFNIREEERIEEAAVTFNACGLWNGALYFFSNTDSVFCRLDLGTDTVEFLKPSMKYPYLDSRILSKFYFGDGIVYALEAGGERMLVMDLENMSFRFAEMNCYQGSPDNYAMITGYGKYVYVVPRAKNRIIRMDADTLNRKDLPIHAAAGRGAEAEDVFEYTCCFRNRAILISPSNHIIVTFDMETEQIERKRLPKSLEGCKYMTWFGSKIWALMEHGEVKQFNEELELEHAITLNPDCGIRAVDIECMEVTCKNIVLLPGTGNHIFLLNLDTEKVTKYQDYPEDFRYIGDRRWTKYAQGCEDDNYYYCPMRTANHLLKIRKEDGELFWIKPKFPKIGERLNYYLKNQELIFDEINIPVQIVVEHMMQTEPANCKPISRHGESIWQAIKESELLKG